MPSESLTQTNIIVDTSPEILNQEQNSRNGVTTKLYTYTFAYFKQCAMCIVDFISTMLEITVGHWPFSDQFQHLADQNLF